MMRLLVVLAIRFVRWVREPSDLDEPVNGVNFWNEL